MPSSLCTFVRKMGLTAADDSSEGAHDSETFDQRAIGKLEETISAYEPGGLCPVDIGSKILDRYLVLDKLAFFREYRPRWTSWVARDEEYVTFWSPLVVVAFWGSFHHGLNI